MVTHEQALAEKYAGRLLHLADGRLVDDLGNDVRNSTVDKVSLSSSSPSTPQGGVL
jgi:hypothetical protein